jgi:hypothetical protein
MTDVTKGEATETAGLLAADEQLLTFTGPPASQARSAWP